jgi:hypothetical protein
MDVGWRLYAVLAVVAAHVGREAGLCFNAESASSSLPLLIAWTPLAGMICHLAHKSSVLMLLPQDKARSSHVKV